MFMKLVCLLFVGLVVFEVESKPSRFRRQNNFDRDDIDAQINNLFRRPERQSVNQLVPTSPAPGNSDDTTTTTASPQFTACLAACASTPEYNPVCGDDRVTYNNMGKLRCANVCGKNVQLLFGGTCAPL